MEKSVIFLLILAMASVMITVNGACVDRELKDANATTTATTMEKVSKFFEEVGCTLKPFTEAVKNKVSSGYNYLKTKIDDSNSNNRTRIPEKGTNIENINSIVMMSNNDSNDYKPIDPDQIIFRENDPISNAATTTVKFNAPTYSTTNGPPNTLDANHETTMNNHHSNGDATLNFATTTNFDTTLKYGTTIGLATELPTTTTDVNLDDRIAISAPEMCPKGHVMVDKKCRREIKL